MTSHSQYRVKGPDTSLEEKIRQYEAGRREKEEIDFAIDIFRLHQRNLPREGVIRRFGLSPVVYDRLLEIGEDEWTRSRFRVKKKRKKKKG